MIKKTLLESKLQNFYKNKTTISTIYISLNNLSTHVLFMVRTFDQISKKFLSHYRSLAR